MLFDDDDVDACVEVMDVDAVGGDGFAASSLVLCTYTRYTMCIHTHVTHTKCQCRVRLPPEAGRETCDRTRVD